jgi:hypothetical protein
MMKKLHEGLLEHGKDAGLLLARAGIGFLALPGLLCMI